MRCRKTVRAASAAALIHKLYAGIVIAILVVIIVALAVPVQVFAYNEAMSELVYGGYGGTPGLIVQNQSYSTSTKQNLFHSATNALTDTEDFAFGSSPQRGIDLAQTSSLTGVGTETGFFNSTASADIVPPVHIGNGYLGTWIGDPLSTGVPIFAGMTFPEMMPTDMNVLAAMPMGLSQAGGSSIGEATINKNAVTSQAAGLPAANDMAGNKAGDMALFSPITHYALNTTLANQSNVNQPSPVIKPGQVFYHQQNKPFSAEITAPSGPFKATPAKIQNTSSFDRFLMNTVGRSTTDKAFNGTTSSPTYITPDKALAVQIPYDFIQGARGMTMPGTRLNYRAWPL